MKAYVIATETVNDDAGFAKYRAECRGPSKPTAASSSCAAAQKVIGLRLKSTMGNLVIVDGPS